MANTIRAAKNTFQGGLVMDLSPDTTPNEVLTSALNATLVTFNGNELQLQNDMGNGRVETARLPEGYIPVGTCEFGGIIYIVSYNPLTNKSQIGCFPSPERNISSEETGGTNQSLLSSDFQEGKILNGQFVPNGELKTTSIKKVIYNNKLNPGDKFIIYDKSDNLFHQDNIPNITDIGNASRQCGTFPKLLRIHVVALQDDGRINFLDSSLKWYSNSGDESSTNYTYFINSGTSNGSDRVPDIDSYRNMLESGYSIFQSKVSGKLALLIELEKITGFSCAYSVQALQEADMSEHAYTAKYYQVYWNFSWTTDDPNINPSYIVLTTSKWEGKDPNLAGKILGWNKVSEGKYELTRKMDNLLQDLPASFTESSTNYYYKGISITHDNLNYVSDIINTDYKYFLEKFSYDNLLQNDLNQLDNAIYSRDNLVKLNIDKYFDEDHYPGTLKFETLGEDKSYKGKYFINADSIITEGTQAGINTTSVSGQKKVISSYPISDIVVNNYFHYPVYKEFQQFFIPYKQNIIEYSVNDDGVVDYHNPKIINSLNLDLSNVIYHYEITPAMSYGLLREYSVEGYIDFSKIGTGEISMYAWKYFIGDNILSLTLGMNAYIEDGKGIDEVVLEFYDDQGMAAAYHMGNKESYSGQFNELIPLNGYTSSYKLTDTDAYGIKHVHCGAIASEDDTDILYLQNDDDNTNVPTILTEERQSNTIYYKNDCGTLYSNMLYLVKIIVKYCRKDVLDNLDTSDTSYYKTFYKWVWTNGIFNDYYYNVQDYDNINLTLTLDVAAQYETNKDYAYLKRNYQNPLQSGASLSAEQLYQNLSATVQIVGNFKQEVIYDAGNKCIKIYSNSAISTCNISEMVIKYRGYDNKTQQSTGSISITLSDNNLSYNEDKTIATISLENALKDDNNQSYNHYDLYIKIPSSAVTLQNETPFTDYENSFMI